MANLDHVAKLLEGVEAWNQWRKENPDIRPDLSLDDETPSLRQAFIKAGINTKNQRIPLAKADPGGANLRGANLRGADLGGADLEGADLGRANLVEANLAGANLGGANLGGANLGGAILRGADLLAADLGGANLRGANLGGADLEGADLGGAVVKSVNSGVGTHYVGTPEFTDLSRTRFLTQDQLDTMDGDTGTILPDGLTRPKHWPDVSQQVELPFKDRVPASDLRRSSRLDLVTAPVDVRWSEDGKLSTLPNLEALNPTPRRFHPPVDPAAQMAQLEAVGAIAGQIANSIRANATENTSALTGDVAVLFEAIRNEVCKTNGIVLIVVIKFNLKSLGRLQLNQSTDALSDVDQAMFHEFMLEGAKLLKLYGVLDEIDDPEHARLVTDDILDDAREKTRAFVSEVLSDETRALIGPEVPDVVWDMTRYIWDDEDENLAERKMIASFAALADRIYKAVMRPPAGLETAARVYAPLAAVAFALIQLFK